MINNILQTHSHTYLWGGGNFFQKVKIVPKGRKIVKYPLFRPGRNPSLRRGQANMCIFKKIYHIYECIFSERKIAPFEGKRGVNF